MSNYKLRDSNSLDTRQPHEPRGEQPAPDADEWRVQRVSEQVPPYLITDNSDWPLAHAFDEKTANRIVTDHARAALVPGLVEALKLCMLDTDLAAMSGNPIANERHKIADAALAAARKAGVA